MSPHLARRRVAAVVHCRRAAEAAWLEASSVPAAGAAGTDGAPRARLQATVPPQRQPHRLAHRLPAATEHHHGVRHRQRALESNEMDMF